MDDWEHPGTGALRPAPEGGGDAVTIDALQQQLSAALERIAALEERVKQLEAGS